MPLTRVVNNVLDSSNITTANITDQTIVGNDFANLSIIGDNIRNNTISLSSFTTGTAKSSLFTNNAGKLTQGINYDNCINRIVYSYEGPRLNAISNSTYSWMPGLFYDYTPLSSSSTIKFTCQWAAAWTGNAHQISHYRYFVNWSEILRFNESGYYPESMVYFQHYSSSWGRSRGRLGMQYRDYSSNRYRLALHTTYYWNGANSYQNCRPQIIIEELLN